MELTAARLSRPAPPSRLGVDLSAHAAYPDAACRRVPDFIALMKPRVMALAVFTAMVGLLIAPGHVDPVLGAVAVLAITAGAGAAGALNMWYDADLDALMSRTAARPIPRGRVSGAEALVFGLLLVGAAVVVLGLVANVKAAALLALTIFFYIAVYTAWLKRSTPQNIVRRRRWSFASSDWLDGGNRRGWARAAGSIPHHLLVDAAAFLGAVAQPQ